MSRPLSCVLITAVLSIGCVDNRAMLARKTTPEANAEVLQCQALCRRDSPTNRSEYLECLGDCPGVSEIESLCPTQRDHRQVLCENVSSEVNGGKVAFTAFAIALAGVAAIALFALPIADDDECTFNCPSEL